MKKIAIVGCGAMGTVLGAYLTKGGLDVEMVDAYAPHVEAMNQKGAQIVGSGAVIVPVKAILPEQMKGPYDLVFLMTKQLANKQVLPQIAACLSEEGIVCTLQNGVPEPFVAELIGKERTVGGAIQWGATFVEPGVSMVTSNLEYKWAHDVTFFSVGEMDGTVTPRIQEVAKVLEHMGKTVVSGNLMDTRWTKLVANCCGSGMSAATGSPFGKVINNPRALECMAMLGREVALCAEAAGRMLNVKQRQVLPDLEAAKTYFYGVYKSAPEGKASMLQDLERGRLTEVDMINGYICRVGDEYGVDTPYNDALVDIVHKMERGELPLDMSNLQYFPE